MNNESHLEKIDLDNKLINAFKDCPYEGNRKQCTLYEFREMELNSKLELLKKMNENEKIKKWRKHLECMMAKLAR
jgi:hypothetical protein